MGKNKWLNLAFAGLLISLITFVGCVPAEGTEGGGGFDWTMIIFLVLIFAMFYFLMIHPQRKRAKERQQMMEALKRGDRVITAGGIYGVIESISEDSVIIKVESGATLRVAKGSVVVQAEK